MHRDLVYSNLCLGLCLAHFLSISHLHNETPVGSTGTGESFQGTLTLPPFWKWLEGGALPALLGARRPSASTHLHTVGVQWTQAEGTSVSLWEKQVCR